MRRIAGLLLVLGVALVGDTSLAGAERAQVQVRPGITVFVPHAWHVFRKALTDCSSPAERLAVASFPASKLGPRNAIPRDGVAVLLLEDGTNPPSAFEPRPERFRTSGRATQFEGCCDMPAAPGYEFMFRDGGRDFEAMVFRGANAPNELLLQATAILNSLQVEAPA